MHILMGFLTYLVIFALLVYFIPRSNLSELAKVISVCIVGALAGALLLAYVGYYLANDLSAGNTPSTYLHCLWWIFRGYLFLPQFIIEGLSSLFQGKWGDVVQCVGYLVLPACCGIGMTLKALDEYDDNLPMIMLMLLLGAVIGAVSMFITAIGWGIVNHFDPGSFVGFIAMIVIIICLCCSGGGFIIILL